MTREDAIYELGEWLEQMIQHGVPSYSTKRKALATAIALLSAEAVQGEWIPSSERLPSEDGKYLVFYEGTIIGPNIDIMWYGEPLMPNVDVSGKHFYRSDGEWGDIIYDEVIAWMPLPEPHGGEEE